MANTTNPAVLAAQKAQALVEKCLDEGRHFRLEAGAGAGKTYSLVKALQRLIAARGADYVRRGQQVACITYTNVAKKEIAQEIDEHPAVRVDTIHAFCWGCMSRFQAALRVEVEKLESHADKIREAGGVGARRIEYDLGFFGIHDDRIALHHDDIPLLMSRLLELPKFREIFAGSYPVVFIDEYQDTDKGFLTALARHFLPQNSAPLIGFFGDHWQTIYHDDFDLAELPNVEAIDKGSNFRSVPAVVDVLNSLRPDLTQVVKDEHAEGEARVFHANSYTGVRTNTSHSKADTPPDIARAYTAALRHRLEADGWDFSSDVTKVLMLTHASLAAEQGYPKVAEIFKSRPDAISKLDDATLEFLGRVVEPMCSAYASKKYGLMFEVLGKTGAVKGAAEKEVWATDMKALQNAREEGTVGQVLDLLKQTKRPRIPDEVRKREEEMATFDPASGTPEAPSVERHRNLREVSYCEVAKLVRYVEGFTPFATQHSVKGAEFENVLVVLGGGWNQYNWPRMLDYLGSGGAISPDHLKGFYRARNLFYVGISRPKRRLAVLLTQTVSPQGLKALERLFGGQVIGIDVPA